MIHFSGDRKRNERYFESGRMIVGLVERCSSVVAAAIASQGRRNTRRNAHTAAMARVNQEAMELRRTLLVVCTHHVIAVLFLSMQSLTL